MIRQIRHKFSIIVNNRLNLDYLLGALNKTLKNKSIDVSFDYDKSIATGQIVLLIKHPNASEEEHWYGLERINLNDSSDMEKFYNQLLSFCNESVKRVPFIRTKNGFEIQNNDRAQYLGAKDAHKSILFSLVEHWSRDNNLDIFDMASDLLIRMAETQCLPNGNKRHAVLITNIFLAEFRLYCVGSHLNISDDYLKNWIDLVTICATKYERVYSPEELDKMLHNEKSNIRSLSLEEIHKRVKKYLIYITYFGLFEQKSLSEQLLLIEYKNQSIINI